MTGSDMIRTFGLGAALAFALAGAAAPQAADDARPDPSPTPKAPPGVAREHQTAYRTDTIELPLAARGEEAETEYFVKMKAGDVLVYSWSVEAAGAAVDPADFYSDFHGATAAVPPMQVLSYREGTGASAAGSLIAPFAGTHGWLFKNDSSRPATVKLTLAGFYDLPSLRESMGLEGPAYVPFGPPDWPYRYGPPKK
jgi:hypothetical protein